MVTILPPVVIVDVIIGNVDTVTVLPLGAAEDGGFVEPVMMVRVTMATPGIVVPEFGNVVTAGKIDVALLGLAGIVITIVLPCGTVTVLLPGSVVTRPLGPPESVFVTTLELAGCALAGIVMILGPVELGVCAVAGIVMTLVPPAGIVTRLVPPGISVVTPEAPPVSVVMTTLELGGCKYAGRVMTLNPPAGTVTTLDPPGRVVVSPEGPP